MPPMRLLPNLVLQLEQCGEISMWFLQIIESVLNLEVMKLDFYPPSPPPHTHTHCPVALAAFSLWFFSLLLSLSHISLSFSLLCLSHFSFLPILCLNFFSGTYKTAPSLSILPSETYTHTHTHTDRAEAGEINSDLNVLSWCVSVVKASVNRVQQRMML